MTNQTGVLFFRKQYEILDLPIPVFFYFYFLCEMVQSLVARHRHCEYFQEKAAHVMQIAWPAKAHARIYC